jgi:hypothetical protein
MSTSDSDLDLSQRIEPWLAKTRSGEDAAGAPTPKIPNITVAPSMGPARLFAQILGGQIGFDVWDEPLLLALARDREARDAMVGALSPASRQHLDEALDSALASEVRAEAGEAYWALRLAGVIGLQGRSILIGLGSHFLLGDGTPLGGVATTAEAHSLALSLRLVVPEDKMVPATAESQGIDLETARRTLEEQDAAQRAFARRAFGRDSQTPSGYDLNLNAASLTLFSAVRLTIRAFEEKFDRTLVDRLPENDELWPRMESRDLALLVD